jgi:hypothetical protein
VPGGLFSEPSRDRFEYLLAPLAPAGVRSQGGILREALKP